MGEITNKGIAAFIAAADQTDHEGYGVTLSGDTVAVAEAANADVVGVITDGAEVDDYTSVALLGACAGSIHFKAGGAITAGKKLMLKADGTWDNALTGVCGGRALEDAAKDELFRGCPLTPHAIA